MKNIIRGVIAVMLCAVLVFTMVGCSNHTEMTEENIRYTVEKADEALKNFDQKALAKYVDSPTLNSIMGIASKQEQFAELGRAIFANMTMEIQSINPDAQTVTVNVTAKDLSRIGRDFVRNLLDSYSRVQLLTKLNSKVFLDDSLGRLLPQIEAAEDEINATVTLKIKKGKHNLMLSFDEEAENAVSGGALTAIKDLFE